MSTGKPEPKVCAACNKEVDWVWGEGDEGCEEWVLDGQWWYDPGITEPRSGFTCSRRCYTRRVPPPEVPESDGL